MRQVEYAKCSVERKEEYRIITTIEVEEGKRYAIKRAACPQAVAHVNRMLAYKDYNYRYDRDYLRFTPCRKLENGVIEFDYITGTLLDDKINTCIQSADWKQMIQLIQKVSEILYGVPNQQAFVYSEEFVRRYGEIPELLGMDAAAGLNIDLIAENIIIDEADIWNVIDYEWTLDYLIPIKYIMYRFLYYQAKLKFIPEKLWAEVLQIARLTPEEWDIFHVMDMKFFQSISQYSLSDLYQLFGRDVIEIDYETLKAAVLTVTIYDEQECLCHQKIVNQELRIRLDVSERDMLHMSFNAPNSIIRVKFFDEQGRFFLPKAFNSVHRMEDEYYFVDPPLFLLDVMSYSAIEIEVHYLTANNPILGRLVDTIHERDMAQEGLGHKLKRWEKGTMDKG